MNLMQKSFRFLCVKSDWTIKFCVNRRTIWIICSGYLYFNEHRFLLWSLLHGEHESLDFYHWWCWCLSSQHRMCLPTAGLLSSSSCVYFWCFRVCLFIETACFFKEVIVEFGFIRQNVQLLFPNFLLLFM